MKTFSRIKNSRSDRKYTYTFADTNRPTSTGYETAEFVLHVAGVGQHKRSVLTRIGTWTSKELSIRDAANLLRSVRS